MKIVTLEIGSRGLAGALLSNGDILCLTRADGHCNELPNPHLRSVREILEEDLLDFVREMLSRVETDQQLHERLVAAGDSIFPADSPLLAPVPNPSFILAQGLAYRNHLDEMNVPLPKEPASLIKAPSSITGPGQPIRLPVDHADMVDYEGEFCAVIGKTCHRVDVDDVYDYIAGYTIINDVSARDWVDAALDQNQTQMQAVRSWGDNMLGKQYPTFTPMGPCLVTRDEIADPHELHLTTRLNGQVMQSAKISDLIFRVEAFIAHYAQWYKFLPGDVISTGTPGGVGQGRDPKVYMRAGDVIEVEVTKIGTLRNPVVNAG